MPPNEDYLLDNRQSAAGERLAALASLFDPSTFRHLDNLGIREGWRCWEVGAGGPSVASFMAERVGVGGSVLASDIDLSWLEGDGGHGFDVLRHDVGADEPPPGPFDLIHARLVLVHVRRRRQALAAMVDVLRPGGWLLVEDADPALQPLTCIDEYGSEQELANRLRAHFRTLLSERGADTGFGRTLPRILRQAGLVDVSADAYFPVTGPACTELERATVLQVREQLVAAGLATEDEIDRHLANIHAGGMDFATSPMVSAWGRAPVVG
ncbi:MAG: methyltransferase [Acidimicrobiales bacterium]